MSETGLADEIEDGIECGIEEEDAMTTSFASFTSFTYAWWLSSLLSSGFHLSQHRKDPFRVSKEEWSTIEREKHLDQGFLSGGPRAKSGSKAEKI